MSERNTLCALLVGDYDDHDKLLVREILLKSGGRLLQARSRRRALPQPFNPEEVARVVASAIRHSVARPLEPGRALSPNRPCASAA